MAYLLDVLGPGRSGLTHFLHIPNCGDQCSGGAWDPSHSAVSSGLAISAQKRRNKYDAYQSDDACWNRSNRSRDRGFCLQGNQLHKPREGY